MQSILSNVISVSNHPVRGLSVKMQSQYVFGIGEFLSYLFNKYEPRSSKKAKSVFQIWIKSFSIDLTSDGWRCQSDFEFTKRIIRKNNRFFSLSRIFVFDCFYISSIVSDSILEKVYCCFKELHIRPRVAAQTFNHWKQGDLINVPLQLIYHWQCNCQLNEKKQKRVLVVATMTAGKSTLINALVGYRVNRVKTTACTSRLCFIYNKPKSKEVITKNKDGSLSYRDNNNLWGNDDYIEIGLHYNSLLSNENICLIDSPGTNYNGDNSHRKITYKAIKSNRYDAIIYVINSTNFFTDDDIKLLKFTTENTRKPIIFVLNKLDCWSPDDDSIPVLINKFISMVDLRINDKYIVPTSALYAFLLKSDNEHMTRFEKLYFKHLSNLFKYDFYNLRQYYRCNDLLDVADGELQKSGIIILESLLINNVS